jgi:hypothetical protein
VHDHIDKCVQLSDKRNEQSLSRKQHNKNSLMPNKTRKVILISDTRLPVRCVWTGNRSLLAQCVHWTLYWVDRALWIMCIITNSMHCLFLVYWLKIPLHVSGINRAHHQEVRCMYVANGTSKMTVSLLTVILEVPFASSWLLYTCSQNITFPERLRPGLANLFQGACPNCV